jgi:hypothetical protein
MALLPLTQGPGLGSRWVPSFTYDFLSNTRQSNPQNGILFIYFALLGFELRAYTLSPLHQSFFCEVFFPREGLVNSSPELASNSDPPDFCLLSS